ncbi:M48 family metallopeptidase [Polaribacter sp.]|uniref:M48 family metallopeptidase n=1 Tax=Polaribacter sp. TaxID=1920175 RepID=UPI004048DBAE
MIEKTLTQFIITVVLFFGTLFALQQVDWISLFKVEQITDKTEEKLGDLLWDSFKASNTENTDSILIKSLDSIVTKISESNDFDKDFFKVHVLNSDEVNAFALPNGHLVIYSGLISDAEHQDELVGVIGHEMAHIQMQHVMKKLIKEIGFSVLISITTGSAGGEIVKQAAKTLSSSAFDRSLEKEADIKAVDYLTNANVNPAPFADFLYRLSLADSQLPSIVSWISTHPDSKERAAYIIEYSKDKKTDFKPILSENTWKTIKEKLTFFDE